MGEPLWEDGTDRRQKNLCGWWTRTPWADTCRKAVPAGKRTGMPFSSLSPLLLFLLYKTVKKHGKQHLLSSLWARKRREEKRTWALCPACELSLSLLHMGLPSSHLPPPPPSPLLLSLGLLCFTFCVPCACIFWVGLLPFFLHFCENL